MGFYGFRCVCELLIPAISSLLCFSTKFFAIYPDFAKPLGALTSDLLKRFASLDSLDFKPHTTRQIMIRRLPTAIKLTPEDVLSYDDEKLRQKKMQQGGSVNSYNQNTSDPQDSVLQRAVLKNRDERLGIRTNSRN